MGKVLYQGILLPRRAAHDLALPDGAPSKVASRASAGWLAALARLHNGSGWGCLYKTPCLRMEKEYQGPKGPEPTRYGDWENKGIASDF